MNADASWLVTRRWAAVGVVLAFGLVPLFLLFAFVAVVYWPLGVIPAVFGIASYVGCTWMISDRLAVDDGDR